VYNRGVYIRGKDEGGGTPSQGEETVGTRIPAFSQWAGYGAKKPTLEFQKGGGEGLEGRT